MAKTLLRCTSLVCCLCSALCLLLILPLLLTSLFTSPLLFATQNDPSFTTLSHLASRNFVLGESLFRGLPLVNFPMRNDTVPFMRWMQAWNHGLAKMFFKKNATRIWMNSTSVMAPEWNQRMYTMNNTVVNRETNQVFFSVYREKQQSTDIAFYGTLGDAYEVECVQGCSKKGKWRLYPQKKLAMPNNDVRASLAKKSQSKHSKQHTHQASQNPFANQGPALYSNGVRALTSDSSERAIASRVAGAVAQRASDWLLSRGWHDFYHAHDTTAVGANGIYTKSSFVVPWNSGWIISYEDETSNQENNSNDPELMIFSVKSASTQYDIVDESQYHECTFSQHDARMCTIPESILDQGVVIPIDISSPNLKAITFLGYKRESSFFWYFLLIATPAAFGCVSCLCVSLYCSSLCCFCCASQKKTRKQVVQHAPARAVHLPMGETTQLLSSNPQPSYSTQNYNSIWNSGTQQYSVNPPKGHYYPSVDFGSKAEMSSAYQAPIY